MKVYDKLDEMNRITDRFQALMQFLDIRMGYATRMLIDTTETIAEISFKCGYNDMSNFNRIFKRKKGCSPTEFRNSYHKIKVIV